ncbi:biotin-dependent carboxyltransferase family protein [Nocardioides panaciterrulae]|uniref:Biotin-dependent carboxylase-like uncharacterized protein n=1 Tax=Nocardioides panaciterrulae TaxID=661492 RepID=A0A7Y9E5B1_9ACTN|nr:biotin-dependent carboxyltransferase family protein [Nocardioides panaciterrulae]NYD41116.1 biotin-dependent carboxylase-like uncharacterized protein [Nocardioides panaciterrulae]
MKSLEVLETGPLATVQDLGRPGQAALGVGRSGAADAASLRLGNRLLRNDDDSAGIEVTYGGLAVRAHGDLLVALTGARCPATVAGRCVGSNSPVLLPDGAELRLGAPATGLRTYLTVRGGVDVAPVLGSRSTDVLAGLGPEVLAPGSELPVGPCPRRQPTVDLAPVPDPPSGEVQLRVVRGPRADWFTDEAFDRLTAAPYEVTNESDRVGMRLRGAALERVRSEELPSEGMVPGALQVPPTGQPTLFLVDHPVTGGYPVLGVVVTTDLGRAAQVRPGQTIHFKEMR